MYLYKREWLDCRMSQMTDLDNDKSKLKTMARDLNRQVNATYAAEQPDVQKF
jgi:hypothetical protein